MNEALRDEFDPSRFGVVDKDDKDSDSAGMGDRTHYTHFTLFTGNQGCPLIPYGGLLGGGQVADAKDLTEFSLVFQAFIEYDGDWQDGVYRAVVKGRYLEKFLRQFRASKRATLRVTGKLEEPSKGQVDSIEICRVV